jgi:hypothetical protein
MNRRRVEEFEAAVSLMSTKVLGGWGGGLAVPNHIRDSNLLCTRLSVSSISLMLLNHIIKTPLEQVLTTLRFFQLSLEMVHTTFCIACILQVSLI